VKKEDSAVRSYNHTVWICSCIVTWSTGGKVGELLAIDVVLRGCLYSTKANKKDFERSEKSP